MGVLSVSLPIIKNKDKDNSVQVAKLSKLTDCVLPALAFDALKFIWGKVQYQIWNPHRITKSKKKIIQIGP
ncbi:MAG: hypothetical protein GY739_04605 [Mesoflavibacter sp.]|nr:hypothetical protein [Mesoflavibacter sp.]